MGKNELLDLFQCFICQSVRFVEMVYLYNPVDDILRMNDIKIWRLGFRAGGILNGSGWIADDDEVFDGEQGYLMKR